MLYTLIRVLVLGGVIVGLLLGSVDGSPRTHYDVAVQAGLAKDVTVEYEIVDEDGLYGSYTPAGVYCMLGFWCTEIPDTIRLQFGKRIPEDMRLFALLHETGHHVQNREGRLKYDTVAELRAIEWDADLFAARKMCELGYDGPDIARRIFAWVYIHVGYTGDDHHGSGQDRVRNVDIPCLRQP
jgi:hypothetical protein